MAAFAKTKFGQPASPPRSGSDRGGVGEGTSLFESPGQCGRLGDKGVISRQQKFFAMEYGWIGPLRIVDSAY